jgi:hypothetical protein
MRSRTRVLALCIASAAVCGCDRNVLDEAPPEIRGTWVTSDTPYEDRAFTIEEKALTLFRGDEAGPVTYNVDRIEFEEIGAFVRYGFEHRDESGEVAVFSVDYAGASVDFMRLVNRPRTTWHRDTKAGTTP